MEKISNDVRTLINELTDKIRDHFDIHIPIQNICDAVSKMGGIVVENYNLDSFSIGKIQKIGERTFKIEIPPFQSKERKNSAIAYNIAHLFIHMGFMVDQTKWQNQMDRTYSDIEDRWERKLENEFVAAFLMPKAEYKRVLEQYTEGNRVDTKQIARYFNVPTDLASSRGLWLGYLQW